MPQWFKETRIELENLKSDFNQLNIQASDLKLLSLLTNKLEPKTLDPTLLRLESTLKNRDLWIGIEVNIRVQRRRCIAYIFRFNQLELRYPDAFFNVNSYRYLGKGYGVKKPTSWTGGWVQTSCDLGWPRISNSVLRRVRALVFGRNAIDYH